MNEQDMNLIASLFGPQLIALVVLMALLIAVLAVLKSLSDKFLSEKKTGTKGSRKTASRYQAQKTLLTRAELSFYHVLMQAMQGEYTVFPKVRMGDALKPNHPNDRSAQATSRNKIDRKHFDFVICCRKTSRILCAVELDDASHKRAKASESDGVKNGACDSAGLVLVRIPAARGYTIERLRELILPHLA